MESVMKIVAYVIKDNTDITIENTCRGEKDVWAIRNRMGQCLNKNTEWEHELAPSNRDEEFFNRCRFTSDEYKIILATEKGLKATESVIKNG